MLEGLKFRRGMFSFTFLKAKEKYVPDYASNIISAFKAYFRDYKGLKWMDGYKHPSGPLKIKEKIEPWKVKRFIEAIDDIV